MAAPPLNVELHTFRSALLHSVVNEAIAFFNQTPVYLLPPVERFAGYGVYALYYLGDFAPYDFIAARNQSQCTQPIYVGKAVPPGSRTGRTPTGRGRKTVRGRLVEHRGSINNATNLNGEHFRCRFILLGGIEADLIATVESDMIRRYRPLWNTIVSGFGIHGPGGGRYGQALSEWDVLHPGRPWGNRLTGIPRELSEIMAKIEQARAQLPLP